jgi:putative chitinase
MLHTKYPTLFKQYGVTTPLRIAHFLGQLEHESNLTPISENLNYSSSGLIRVFRKYFTDLESIQFQRQPQKIANRVYANRMGNGNEASGDGWKYRGRGFIQLTGKSNYSELSKAVGIDFVANPDLLLDEPNALISALWFWNKHNLNKFADGNDIVSITKKINGGTIGLNDRIKKVNKWHKLLS